MTNGVLIFAYNNEKIDYVEQAIFCASKVKEHLGLEVAIVTDNKRYIQKKFSSYKKYFDHVITDKTVTNQRKKFFNKDNYEVLKWNNLSRAKAYDLTPFDKTLVLDSDFIIGNCNLLKCFQNNFFKINSNFVDIDPQRNDPTLYYVSDTSIELKWATVFYFKKNRNIKYFFNLIKFIQKNWNWYIFSHQIPNNNFRNDFAFSIALHEMQLPYQSLPSNLFFSFDRDKIIRLTNNDIVLQTQSNLVVNVSDVNIHLMNKYSLRDQIQKELYE